MKVKLWLLLLTFWEKQQNCLKHIYNQVDTTNRKCFYLSSAGKQKHPTNKNTWNNSNTRTFFYTQSFGSIEKKSRYYWLETNFNLCYLVPTLFLVAKVTMVNFTHQMMKTQWWISIMKTNEYIINYFSTFYSVLILYSSQPHVICLISEPELVGLFKKWISRHKTCHTQCGWAIWQESTFRNERYQ